MFVRIAQKMAFLNLCLIAGYSAAVLSSEDSINFMWINKKKDLNAQYIFPDLRLKIDPAWDVNILDWLSLWIEANPQATGQKSLPS